jgi:hypothetical protein
MMIDRRGFEQLDSYYWHSLSCSPLIWFVLPERFDLLHIVNRYQAWRDRFEAGSETYYRLLFPPTTMQPLTEYAINKSVGRFVNLATATLTIDCKATHFRAEVFCERSHSVGNEIIAAYCHAALNQVVIPKWMGRAELRAHHPVECWTWLLREIPSYKIFRWRQFDLLIEEDCQLVLDADVTSIAKPSNVKSKKFQPHVEKTKRVTGATAEVRHQRVKLG